jgi:transposase
VPEVRRLLLTLAEPPWRSAFRLAWSRFRRRHQAGAKRCHTARRAQQPRVAPGSPLIHLLSARRFALSAEQWARIVPLLPPQKPRTGRPNHDYRTFLAGMLWLLQTGTSWRELPAQFGPWQTVYHRYQRWRQAGIWPQVLDILSQSTATAPPEVSL